MHRTDKLSIGVFDFYRCGCVPGAQRWVRPLQLHGTGVARGLAADWKPADHVNNTLVGLGPHSVPLFLIKGEYYAKIFNRRVVNESSRKMHDVKVK